MRLQLLTGLDPLLSPLPSRPDAPATLVPAAASPARARGSADLCSGPQVGGIDSRWQLRAPTCTLSVYERDPVGLRQLELGCQLAPATNREGSRLLFLLVPLLLLLLRRRPKVDLR